MLMSYVAGELQVYGVEGAVLPEIAAIGRAGFAAVWVVSGADGLVHVKWSNDETTVAPATVLTYEPLTSLAMSSLADGGHVVVWSGPSDAGTGQDIYLTRFDEDGGETASARRVVKFFGDQTHVDAIGLKNGGYVLAWQDSSGDADASAVFQQRYGADGSAIGRAVRVNTHVQGDQAGAKMTALADGGWVTSWSSQGQEGRAPGLYQAVFNPDGSVRVNERHVGAASETIQYNQSVATLADGGWVVAWETLDASGATGNIHWQRYNPDGSRAGSTFALSENPDPFDERRPAVVGLKDGGWAMSYSSVDLSGDGLYGVWVVIYDAEGNIVRQERTDSGVGNIHDHSDLALLANGDLAVAWSTKPMTSDSDAGINHRVYDFVEDSVLRGNANANTLDGAGERDVIRGLGGNDVLRGRGGADAILGGAGNDRIVGGTGNDQLAGNAGADRFIFATGFGRDVILDFRATGSARDVLDLAGVASIRGMADLRSNHMTQLGDDVLIKAGAEDWLVLRDVKLGQLSAANFDF
jgi:Ca2+-binding RTX toxin-like protein